MAGLFGCIPLDAFRVFVGDHAPVAEAILLRLRTSFFGEFSGAPPEREDIKRAITATLTDYGGTARTAGNDGDQQTETAEANVEYLYGRLRDAGWLIEEPERWRVFVDMPLWGRRLLGLLESLKEEITRSFTGLVSEVSTLINATIDDPKRHATNIDGAARVASSFRQLMATIESGIAEFSRTLDHVESLDEAIIQFFTDFLSAKVADWAQVMAVNNPWRSRNNIANAIRHFKRSPTALTAAAAGYAEARHAETTEAAELKILARLDDIERCLDDIERLRARIEDRQRLVEDRISNILRYIGRNPALSRERIAAALGALSQLGDGEEIEVSFRVLDFVEPYGEVAFPEIREALPIASQRALHKKEPDPLFQVYTRACRDFDRDIAPGPRQLIEWLDRASERQTLAPQSAREWFAWRAVALRARPEGMQLGRFRIRRTADPARCKYGSLAGFEIVREDGDAGDSN